MHNITTNRLYRICEWIMRLATLNGLWLLGILMGLGAFGVMPATTAMFAVAREWIKSPSADVNVWKTFRNAYQQDFLRSNTVGGLWVLLGGFLWIDFYYFHNQEAVVFQVLSVGIVLLGIFYMTAWGFLWAVLAHYDCSLKQVFQNAFVTALLHPFHSLSLLAGMILIGGMTLQFPILFLFFSGSTYAYLAMWLAYRVFIKLPNSGLSVASV